MVVPDSTHCIQYDQPQAVIDAVTRALMAIRRTPTSEKLPMLLSRLGNSPTQLIAS